MPSRVSAAIRLDQKARVLPLRICGFRFNAKNADGEQFETVSGGLSNYT